MSVDVWLAHVFSRQSSTGMPGSVRNLPAVDDHVSGLPYTAGKRLCWHTSDTVQGGACCGMARWRLRGMEDWAPY